MTVGVTVSFNYEDQRWTHAFDVEPGTTMIKLKEKMVEPKGGTKKDADFFELRLRGQRVSDAEEIHQPVTLDFEYLGAEEGAKRAKEDEIDRVRRDKEKQEALTKMNKQKSQPTPKSVPVTPPAKPAGDLVINVVVDAELDFKSDVKVIGGSTIADLKVKLAAMDPTGSTKPETFGLALNKIGANALPDSTVLTDAHLQLQVSEPYKGPSQPSKPVDASAEVIPGVTIWKVVGGSEKGGILVRKGQQTTSPQLSDRLATGAIVEQVELVGERLHYRTISGAGPTQGWVSLTVQGKELLKRLPAGTPESFPMERALALQQDMLIAFQLPKFQDEMNSLIDEIPTKAGGEFMMQRNAIIFSAQRDILVKYGFEGSAKGVTLMIAAFGPHMHSPLAQANSAEIDKLLQI